MKDLVMQIWFCKYRREGSGGAIAVFCSVVAECRLRGSPSLLRRKRRAGVPQWSRLFHSMRASWQTELQREFPIHVVCSWLGNSPRIAQQSYLLVTEDDFAKAAGSNVVEPAAQLIRIA